MGQPTFSVVIPAYNEEMYLPRTLAAIRHAADRLGEEIEVVIGDNMSTDRTAEVAEELGAKVVRVERRCISTVRNEAAAQTTGRYLAFIDADDLMSEDALVEIKSALDTGKFVGGGMVDVRMDRQSFGLSMTWSIINRGLRLNGLSMYLFYTTREVFDAIGGFNEELYSTEDHDFATRMRRLGKKQGLKYCNLRKGHIIKSARKFDEFGDWCIFRHPIKFLRACLNDQKVAYEFWYKPRRIPAKADSSSTRAA